MKGKIDFNEAYEKFQPKIARYLTRLVGEHGIDDLTQEVFVKVSLGLKNFRGESQLSTWIYRIATNAALDRLRSPSSFRSPAFLLKTSAVSIAYVVLSMPHLPG